MQTLREIRGLLEEAGLAPRRQFGQCFLIDGNLMGKLLALAELSGGETVLEVGPGTGSLTEELLQRAERVVAAEIDRGLCELLRRRLEGREGLTLICGDVLAGKHRIAPEVLEALCGGADLVANLPYSVATPLVAECLIQSWRAAREGGGRAAAFRRLTFTVQREVAERLTARPGEKAYGPVSVWAALLGRIKLGPAVPPSAFWPRPKVDSRILRIDFQAGRAGELADAKAMAAALSMAFAQRRKQVGGLVRRAGGAAGEAVAAALAAGGIDLACRPDRVAPEQYLAFANALAAGREGE